MQVQVENLEPDEETKEYKPINKLDELGMFDELGLLCDEEEDKISNSSARVGRRVKLTSHPNHLELALDNLLAADPLLLTETRKRSGSFSRIPPPLPTTLTMLSKK